MPKLRAVSARTAAIRVRMIQRAHLNFNEALATLDRLERIGRRLHSALMVDTIVEIRGAVIDACAPGQSRVPQLRGEPS